MKDDFNKTKTAKIFGIGLSKTGTTSLFAALHILGYASGTYRQLRRKILSEWFCGNFSFDYISDLEAVTDLPIGAFYPALDVRYPGSKFILTTRNKDDWLKSCQKFFGPEKKHARDKTSFYYSTQLASYGVVSFNEEIFSYIYDCHENSVRNYFRERPEDLLFMSIVEGDGWQKLCSFLGKPIPNVEFPHILPGEFLLPDELKSKRQSSNIVSRFTRLLRKKWGK